MPPIEGHVELRDVWMSYNEDEDVLRGVSLDRRAGADDRHRGADRRGQDHDHQPAAALL